MDRAATLVVMITAVGIGLACSSSPERSETAPDFNDISAEQLESSMWRLASGVRDLHAIFRSGRPIRQTERPEVVRLLDEMIAAADELGPEGVDTHHARITENLGRFREKLTIARSSVAETPPSYLLVRNIAGTCLSCHRSD